MGFLSFITGKNCKASPFLWHTIIALRMKAIDEQIIAKPLSPVVQNWTREVVTLALSLLYWKVELLLSRARSHYVRSHLCTQCKWKENNLEWAWASINQPLYVLRNGCRMKKWHTFTAKNIHTKNNLYNNSVSGWWWLARCEAGCLLFPESQFSTENLRLRLRCRDSQDWRHSLSCLRDKARPRNKNRPVNYNPSLKQMDKKASI